ncbi:hypothetical protein [Roseiconus lacunae]|uniref:hypothetical protein n=2 Tax=Roseiconus lacunae TaxID=2605694 RepID=UPI00135B8775|nr:hypothetical protein [Roseiconus lacunae]
MRRTVFMQWIQSMSKGYVTHPFPPSRLRHTLIVGLFTAVFAGCGSSGATNVAENADEEAVTAYKEMVEKDAQSMAPPVR